MGWLGWDLQMTGASAPGSNKVPRAKDASEAKERRGRDSSSWLDLRACGRLGSRLEPGIIPTGMGLTSSLGNRNNKADSS